MSIPRGVYYFTGKSRGIFMKFRIHFVTVCECNSFQRQTSGCGGRMSTKAGMGLSITDMLHLLRQAFRGKTDSPQSAPRTRRGKKAIAVARLLTKLRDWHLHPGLDPGSRLWILGPAPDPDPGISSVNDYPFSLVPSHWGRLWINLLLENILLDQRQFP